jgi:hypothetical protein
LYITCCTLHVVHYMLYITCCTLHVVHYMLYITCCTLHVVHYMLYITCCTLQDPHGNTALHLAVMLGRKECVHLLSAHGAPVKAKNNQGWSPLAEAIRSAQFSK